MSHTVKVNVELRNFEAVKKAVLEMKGTILTGNSHRLFNSTEVGLGFTLPGWRYPLVVHQDGSIAYDDYHGSWGKPQDIEVLKAEYALFCAEAKCDELGWYHERNGNELVVFHPEGGTITIQRSGLIDATGFKGKSCASATEQLEQAMGTKSEQSLKPEYGQVQLEQGEKES